MSEIIEYVNKYLNKQSINLYKILNLNISITFFGKLSEKLYSSKNDI